MSDQMLLARLEHLLSESVDSVRQRQCQALENALGGEKQPFVLFGAGNLGRRVVGTLLEQGMRPLAFIDNNPKLWGTTISGIEVLSPAQLAARERGDLPAVLTTIWFGEASDRMSERLAPLKELGFEKFALFGHLAWRFPEKYLPYFSLDLPEKVLAEAASIRKAYSLLGDDISRRIFVDHVEWRLFMDYDLLPAASALEIYFDGHFTNFCSREVVYDIGAFNGDSILGYLGTGRPYSEIHSFEPSARNFSDLKATIEKLAVKHPGLYAHALAVGDAVAEISIESDNGPSSRVGKGSEVVHMTTLDILSEEIAPPTFIKIDIEGFEPQCLAGGKRLISEVHPVMAVCVYHEQAHLWSLLLQLHGYYDGYRYTLCPHVADGWDLVLYAVPADRVPN